MPLETATWITDLVPANPAHSDGLNQTDAHLRLIKAVLQAAFPGLNGAVTCTPTELNQLHAGTRSLGLSDGTSGAPSISFDSEPANGFYKPSAGHLKATKRLQGNGTIPVGSLHSFPLDPGTTLVARGGTATGAEEYVELDGSVYNIATFPDLGALYGSTFGGNGTTTFGVPNTKDTGRYLRSRTNSLAVGTTQANAFTSHTHSLSVSGGPTLTSTEDATHTHNAGVSLNVTTGGAASGPGTVVTAVSLNVSPTDTESAGHHHSISLTSTGTSGAPSTGSGAETRPESLVVIRVAKT